jgi:hypothetical protein
LSNHRRVANGQLNLPLVGRLHDPGKLIGPYVKPGKTVMNVGNSM